MTQGTGCGQNSGQCGQGALCAMEGKWTRTWHRTRSRYCGQGSRTDRTSRTDRPQKQGRMTAVSCTPRRTSPTGPTSPTLHPHPAFCAMCSACRTKKAPRSFARRGRLERPSGAISLRQGYGLTSSRPFRSSPPNEAGAAERRLRYYAPRPNVGFGVCAAREAREAVRPTADHSPAGATRRRVVFFGGVQYTVPYSKLGVRRRCRRTD